MTDFTRRQFLVGCSSAIAAMAGTRFGSVSFAREGEAGDTLVVVFLRGGMDGLSLLSPTDHPDRGFYEQARGRVAVPVSGSNGSLDVGQGFGLHRGAAGLHRLFQDGHLALFHATGLRDIATRSHFDAMAHLERGASVLRDADSGWLARHLNSAGVPNDGLVTTLAAGSLRPASLAGRSETVNVQAIENFDLEEGYEGWRSQHRDALRRLVAHREDDLGDSFQQALAAVDSAEQWLQGQYRPSGGARYPDGALGDHLKTIARLIKAGLGLRVATVDVGGWDTHVYQGSLGAGYFFHHIEELALGLEAFLTDLDDPVNRLSEKTTVVVMSEFGRRLEANDDEGTDHGHGNVTMVAGGAVEGGLYGQWPGLDPELLFDGVDLAVTTDTRQILSEILVQRFGNHAIEEIFPRYGARYAGAPPLGFLRDS